MNCVVLRPGDVSLAEWRAIYRGAEVRLDPTSGAAIEQSAAAVERILAKGEPVYGINTGFGNSPASGSKLPTSRPYSATSCCRTPPASAPPPPSRSSG